MLSLPNLQGRFFRFQLSVKPAPALTLAGNISDLLQVEDNKTSCVLFAQEFDRLLQQIFGLPMKELCLAFKSSDLTEDYLGLVELQKDATSVINRRNPGVIPISILHPFFNSFDLRLEFVRFFGSYPSCKTPFKRFKQCQEGEIVCWTQNQDTWGVVPHTKSILAQLLQSSGREEQFNLVLDHYEDEDFLTGRPTAVLRGLSQIPDCPSRSWTPALILREEFEASLPPKPLCFPIWAADRIVTLSSHKCTISCSQCSELSIWKTLEFWYREIFCQRDKTQDMMLADGSVIQVPIRNHGLIVLGDRGTGKTRFFESICGARDDKIIHIKNKFNSDQWKQMNNAWLLLVDDFQYCEERDLEIFKALVTSEKTIIDGKWLSLAYRGGIPCVILCNNEELYEYFRTSPYFKDECLFLNLQDHFIGPPDFLNQQREKVIEFKEKIALFQPPLESYSTSQKKRLTAYRKKAMYGQKRKIFSKTPRTIEDQVREIKYLKEDEQCFLGIHETNTFPSDEQLDSLFNTNYDWTSYVNSNPYESPKSLF